MREIVFDTETTGLDPKSGDRMVEIGCVEIVNKVPTGATYHCYYNPERDMPVEAERVHGLSAKFLAGQSLFRDRLDELLEFLADSPLVAHNAGFDFGFVDAELVLCNRDRLDRARMIDTVALAKKKHPGAKLSLDALCTRYGIDRSHRVKHGALLDAELLAQVYVELTGGRQIGLALAADQAVLVGEAQSSARPVTRGPRREPRPHSASEAELAAHRSFLKSIEAPLWSG